LRNHIKELVLRFVPHRLMLALKQLEVVLRCYYLHFYYEKDAYQLLEIVGTLSEGIAIDVGANMGQFSFPISRLPNCTKVISIEPQPIVSNLFRMMTSVLGVDKIEHVEVLLSDTNGFAYIHTPNRSGHLVNQETFMIHESKNDNDEKIKVIRLDDLIAEYRINPEQIILVKIDVEGAELGVLKGAEQIISMSRPIIMVELIDNFLCRFGASFGQPFAWLEQFGYKAYWYDGKHLVLFAEDDSQRSPSGNYYFIPNGSVPKKSCKK
jgi:FkbM family methyltransferase